MVLEVAGCGAKVLSILRCIQSSISGFPLKFENVSNVVVCVIIATRYINETVDCVAADTV